MHGAGDGLCHVWERKHQANLLSFCTRGVGQLSPRGSWSVSDYTMSLCTYIAKKMPAITLLCLLHAMLIPVCKSWKHAWRYEQRYCMYNRFLPCMVQSRSSPKKLAGIWLLYLVGLSRQAMWVVCVHRPHAGWQAYACWHQHHAKSCLIPHRSWEGDYQRPQKWRMVCLSLWPMLSSEMSTECCRLVLSTLKMVEFGKIRDGCVLHWLE